MAWEHVTFAESDDKPGVEYEIQRRTEDGAVRCGCEAFRFTKGQLGTPEKACKHMKALRLAGQQASVQVARPAGRRSPQRARRATVAPPAAVVETFTFRRGITFGAVPTGGKG